MTKFLIQYGIVLVIFFAIDMIWLGLIAKNFYAKKLGFLMAPKVNWIAAFVFYLIFILGLLVFVIQPALAAESLTQGIFMAALFGLVTYATYDLTNLATLKDWPLIITIVDLAWGISLSVIVSTLSILILTRL
ncbi:MAG: hypothetical protein FD133_471 [Erysipelotrichaceae bacterium]|nr:MAG: hypothetical protein FD179_1605 [Erysipelotrichaceae bacterium]TXT19201.1 MAG: hypothetical protein FD133_471 [Erysipelotrichaceae bacterium]